jgi:hypothetical protein
MLSPRMVQDLMYLTWSTYNNLLRSLNSDKQSHYPQEKGSVPSFSPEPVIEAVGVKPPSVDDRLLGLPGP